MDLERDAGQFAMLQKVEKSCSNMISLSHACVDSTVMEQMRELDRYEKCLQRRSTDGNVRASVLTDESS